jgi:magnesium-transporting ATPase (P-type)
MAEKKTKKEVKKEEFRYSRKNWILIFSGLLVGIISLVLMGLGDITISVILFVIAFLVLIPIGLLLKP